MPRMSLEIVDTKKQVEYCEKNLKDRTIGKKIWQTTKKFYILHVELTKPENLPKKPTRE